MNDDDNYNDEHDPHKIMHSHLSCYEKWIYVLVAMMMALALVFSLLLSSCTIVRYDAQMLVEGIVKGAVAGAK